MPVGTCFTITEFWSDSKILQVVLEVLSAGLVKYDSSQSKCTDLASSSVSSSMNIDPPLVTKQCLMDLSSKILLNALLIVLLLIVMFLSISWLTTTVLLGVTVVFTGWYW